MNYKCQRWEDKRIVILKRDVFKCKECLRYGKTKAATTVHHCLPAEQCTPDMLYDNDNLISLCDKCHNQMHKRSDRTLTEKGYALMRRRLYGKKKYRFLFE